MPPIQTPVNIALVLVGGFGTRLRSVVPDRPKALVEISGRPFLAWQLDALFALGITRAILCTHHMNEMIEAAFPTGTLANGMSIVHSHEPKPLGTGGALRLGVEAIAEPEGAVLALNGDTFCRFDLASMWAEHCRAAAIATVLLTKVDDVSRYGAITTQVDGHIVAFQEKNNQAPAPGWINAGTYLIACDVLRALPLGCSISLERDVFPSWIGQGLNSYKGGSHFLDIGTPESYARAEEHLASTKVS